MPLSLKKCPSLNVSIREWNARQLDDDAFFHRTTGCLQNINPARNIYPSYSLGTQKAVASAKKTRIHISRTFVVLTGSRQNVLAWFQFPPFFVRDCRSHPSRCNLLGLQRSEFLVNHSGRLSSWQLRGSQKLPLICWRPRRRFCRWKFPWQINLACLFVLLPSRDGVVSGTSRNSLFKRKVPEGIATELKHHRKNYTASHRLRKKLWREILQSRESNQFVFMCTCRVFKIQ